jgi:hypothetical protein
MINIPIVKSTGHCRAFKFEITQIACSVKLTQKQDRMLDRMMAGKSAGVNAWSRLKAEIRSMGATDVDFSACGLTYDAPTIEAGNAIAVKILETLS